jgi:hypothetical protein
MSIGRLSHPISSLRMKCSVFNVSNLIFGFVIVLSFSFATAGQTARPSFGKYSVSVYRGETHFPAWARHIEGSEWRNEQNKLISNPLINFAGRYYIAVNSLGAGAWYFSMTDLRSGRDLSLLDRFATTENSPTLPNGNHFAVSLTYRPNSRLLKARFQQQDWAASSGPCYERYFVLARPGLRPVGAKRYRCIDE